MFVRIEQDDNWAVCYGRRSRDQKWSNAKRSAGSILKRWPCRSYKPEMAERFARRQGHILERNVG